jgi:hypothetical protein
MRGALGLWLAHAGTRFGFDTGGVPPEADELHSLSRFRSNDDPGGSRTRDLRIKSPLLYQLSYRVNPILAGLEDITAEPALFLSAMPYTVVTYFLIYLSMD